MWTVTDANVVCKKLGFHPDGKVYAETGSIFITTFQLCYILYVLLGGIPMMASQYENSSSVVLLAEPHCTGSEASLLQCAHSTSVQSCNGTEVAVQCEGITIIVLQHVV